MRVFVCAVLLALLTIPSVYAQDAIRVLATNRTSTMEKEMNEAADNGFRFASVMGGETSFGGSEVVAVMVRTPQAKSAFQYKLLATNKTSTMQKELQQAGDSGFAYRGQTVFKSAFGGNEVVVILERDKNGGTPLRYEYRLLASKRTSTLEKETAEAMAAGYEFVGLTVAETAVAGEEIVCIVRRRAQ